MVESYVEGRFEQWFHVDSSLQWPALSVPAVAGLPRDRSAWNQAKIRLVAEHSIFNSRATAWRPDVAAAESAFMRAIEIARSQQTRTFELRAALSLAKFYQTMARHEAASELLGPALVGFSAGPEVPEVEQAQRLLNA